MTYRVLCFGNLWQGDDGVGIHVLRRLSAMPLAERVTLHDAGTLGIGALNYFEDCDKVVVVDAMAYGGSLGKVHRLRLDDVAAPAATFTAHAMDLSHLFHALPIIFDGKRMPEIVIIAVEIGKVEAFTDRLSPQVAAAVPVMIEGILDEVGASEVIVDASDARARKSGA